MNSTVKWVELDIVPAGRGNTEHAPRDPLAPILAELAKHPGRWAELDRYPMDRLQSARSRGANIKKRYPGIEYAVIPEGASAGLYLRQEPTS